MRVTSLRGRRGQLREGEVYVGRAVPTFMTRGAALAESDWANPFRIGRDGSRDQVLARYETWLTTERPDLMARLFELAGHDLACWCAPQPCHADVLVRLASSLPPGHPATHAGERRA